LGSFKFWNYLNGSAFDILEVLLALRHVHGYCPSLEVTKHANPSPVQAGAPLTYTIYVTNTGHVTLTTTITDFLPAHISPSGVLTWPPIVLGHDEVWTETVTVTVTSAYTGALTNKVKVTTEEGVGGTAGVTICSNYCFIYLPIVFVSSICQ
jgi:uncharacterized repeat protein (TIGR01451 family)